MTDLEPLVFVVDDDAPIRKGLGRLLKSTGYQVETFSSADEFLKRERHDGPCCVVLDVQMPGLSGLDLQKEMAAAGHNFPIIFITGHGNVPMSVQAMKAGAADFLTKPVRSEALLDAIRQAIERHTQARKARAGVEEIQARMNLLTTREREVLSLVVTGRLNKQVADELGISEKTVKVHRARVMQKMQAQSLAELVRVSEEVGVKPPLPR